MADESRTGSQTLAFVQSPNAIGWQEFVLRYSPRILAWARKRGLSKEDCEDINQDVLVRLHRSMRTYVREKGSFRGWLFRVTENAVNSLLNDKKKARAWSLLDTDGDSLTGEAGIVEAIVESDCLNVALERTRLRIGEKKWACFYQHKFKGFSYEDLMESTGLNRGTLMNYVSEAKNVFEGELESLNRA